jgi:hypothetical protein
MDCGESLGTDKISKWVNLYHKLSFAHFYNDGEETSKCADSVSYYSVSNWNKTLSTLSSTSSKFRLILDGASIKHMMISVVGLSLLFALI